MMSLAVADARALRMLQYQHATQRQIDYARYLIAERQTNLLNEQTWRPIVMAVLGSDITMVEKSDCSELIDTLKKLPVKVAVAYETGQPPSTARPSLPKVEPGRYALRDVDGYKNEVAFFKVDRPIEGRWAGQTFVKQYRSDEELPVRGDGARKVLELIAQDPKSAMILYGTETSKCGHCGRRLTDDESRARGIGPVCAEKMGW